MLSDILCDDRTMVSVDGRIAILNGMAYDIRASANGGTVCLGAIDDIATDTLDRGGHCSCCGAPRGMSVRCAYCGAIPERGTSR